MGYLHAADSAPSSPSLKQRIRSAGCFSCCFRGCGGDLDPPSPSDGPQPAASLIHQPSAWLRSKAQELPELRERCRGIVARVGRHRRHAGDFGYDALSYALNFDDGPDLDDEGEISPERSRYRSFSSRLPPTPPHPAAAAAGVKEIACA
ncbi:hypothetical protein Taro_024511 [Colocasia esculenta]|uniref:Uncharacterized protein n=1 Tax=Colocasia esculenta TaxID=4460 RepID=A0A843VER7_COLES|nr:hypothetical protein [Colocasia esculenta]